MTSAPRFAVVLLVAAALGLVALVPVSARTDARSKYGGTLVVGTRNDPDSLDPTVSRLGAATAIYRVTCEQLYDYDARLRLRPLLAAAVPVLSKDKLSYTIPLRKGILFNDGTPFNAQAVVTTIRRFMTYPGSSRASDYAGVASVTASDPYTVVFRMKARDSTFTGNSYILSSTQLDKLGDDFASKPICVGPFVFDHRVAGDSVTVIKSPWYYDRKDVYLDGIVFKQIPNASSLFAALKAGDVQAINQMSTTDLSAAQQMPGLRVLQGYNLGWFGIFINVGNRAGVGNLPYATVDGPLARSPKLRQAFEEAIDRTTMNNVVFSGLAKPGCTPIGPALVTWYDTTKVPCTPYNPKDAKKLVTASGFSNPTVHLLTRNLPDDSGLAQFIQEQEKAVGINVVIDPTDATTATGRAESGNFDAFLFGLTGQPDPSTVIYPVAATTGARNYSGYSNARLDLILSNALKATSIEARSTLYRAAQQILQADRPIIVLQNQFTYAAVSTSLTGVRLDATGALAVANAQFK